MRKPSFFRRLVMFNLPLMFFSRALRVYICCYFVVASIRFAFTNDFQCSLGGALMFFVTLHNWLSWEAYITANRFVNLRGYLLIAFVLLSVGCGVAPLFIFFHSWLWSLIALLSIACFVASISYENVIIRVRRIARLKFLREDWDAYNGGCIIGTERKKT